MFASEMPLTLVLMLALPRRATDDVGQLFPLVRNYPAALFQKIGCRIPDLLALVREELSTLGRLIRDELPGLGS
jgi:hypothetical protein